MKAKNKYTGFLDLLQPRLRSREERHAPPPPFRTVVAEIQRHEDKEAATAVEKDGGCG
ncbi:unnamed protein product [Brassica oleracea]|uniref:Uncharacterized protein n=2 Tax=Brassica TaxID=3705 RepID=A0A3P6GQ73_BRAOL|nr:unnamed protein product [Brassica napus]VDD58022.1 unnamed protein product [Brassica oleracea]